jgi:hypothetical protein
MKRMIIWVVLIVVVIGGLIAYYMYNEETADIVNKKPDVVVDAATMIADFQKDTTAASKKYMDKIVNLTGELKKIDTTGTLIFGTANDPSEVVVGLDRRHMKDYQGLSVGSKVTVQGRCSGYTSSNGDPDDMLGSLGTTVELKTAGIKTNNNK